MHLLFEERRAKLDIAARALSEPGALPHDMAVLREALHMATILRQHAEDSDAIAAAHSEAVYKMASEDDHKSMNAVTREEIDARLETIEVKMDSRIASIAGKIDAFLVRAEGHEKVLELIGQKAADAAQSAAASADRASGLKGTMWLTSITTIIAVLGIAFAAYFGTQQSNIGIVQAVIAAVDSTKPVLASPIHINGARQDGSGKK